MLWYWQLEVFLPAHVVIAIVVDLNHVVRGPLHVCPLLVPLNPYLVSAIGTIKPLKIQFWVVNPMSRTVIDIVRVSFQWVWGKKDIVQWCKYRRASVQTAMWFRWCSHCKEAAQVTKPWRNTGLNLQSAQSSIIRQQCMVSKGPVGTKP